MEIFHKQKPSTIITVYEQQQQQHTDNHKPQERQTMFKLVFDYVK